MQDQRRKITNLIAIGTLSASALMVVTGWRSSVETEVEHMALLRDSAVKVRNQVRDAKLLLSSYSAAHTSALKEWCKESAKDLSSEINSPWWRRDQAMFAGDDPDEWRKMQQLSEPIIAALENPDSSTDLDIKPKLDALGSALNAMVDEEYNAWETRFTLKPRLLLLQYALQLVILLVLSILMFVVNSAMKNQPGVTH